MPASLAIGTSGNADCDSASWHKALCRQELEGAALAPNPHEASSATHDGSGKNWKAFREPREESQGRVAPGLVDRRGFMFLPWCSSSRQICSAAQR